MIILKWSLRMVVQAYLFLVNKLDSKMPKKPQETIHAAASLTEPQISNSPHTESLVLPQQAVASPTSASGLPVFAKRKRPLPDESSKNDNLAENLDDPAKIAKHEFEKDDHFFLDSKDEQPLDESGNFLRVYDQKKLTFDLRGKN